jgi:hypothetical protein
MSERDLYSEPPRAIAGQTHGLTGHTRTYSAGEKIFPGSPLFGFVGDDEHCYNAHANAETVTLDAPLVTGNIVVVTINGITLAAVEFVESSTKTLERIVRAIDINTALGDLGINAFIVEGANAFTITGPGITITASVVITGGASIPVVEIEPDTNMKFIGVAEHTELVTNKGTGFYDINDSVNVRDGGDIFAPVDDESFPSDKEEAYIDITKGVFTDVATGNYDCGCFFRSNKQDGLARVEVRGMK